MTRNFHLILILVISTLLTISCGSSGVGSDVNPGERLSGANLDLDKDGLNGDEEAACGSKPLSKDTDGDGLDDYQECKIFLSSPVNKDSNCNGTTDDLDPEPGLSPGTLTINSGLPAETANWKILGIADPGPTSSSPTFDDSNYIPAVWLATNISGVWNITTYCNPTCPFASAYLRGIYTLPEPEAAQYAKIKSVTITKLFTDDSTIAVDFNGTRLTTGNVSSPTIYPVDTLAVKGVVVFGVSGYNSADRGAMHLEATLNYSYHHSVAKCPH